MNRSCSSAIDEILNGVTKRHESLTRLVSHMVNLYQYDFLSSFQSSRSS